MKKTLKSRVFVIILVVILTFSITACSENSTENSNASVSNQTTTDENGLITGNVVDFSKNLDGFRVVTVGSGSPAIDANRGSAATIVQYQDKYFLVDCGVAATQDLMKQGLYPSKITNLLITHQHEDHNADFVTFLISGWGSLTGRRSLNLMGPGVQTLYDTTVALYKTDIADRMANFPAEGIYNNININNFDENIESFELDGVKITALKVQHFDIDSYAYKFEAGGQSVVITGDLIYSDQLAEFCKGCDIIVCDANQFSSFASVPEEKREAFITKLDVGHISRDNICKLATLSECDKFVLSHINGELTDSKTIMEKFKNAGYTGEVYGAFDGMEILP